MSHADDPKSLPTEIELFLELGERDPGPFVVWQNEHARVVVDGKTAKFEQRVKDALGDGHWVPVAWDWATTVLLTQFARDHLGVAVD